MITEPFQTEIPVASTKEHSKAASDSSSAITATSANLMDPELIAAIVAGVKLLLAKEKLPSATTQTQSISNSTYSHSSHYFLVGGLPEWTDNTPSGVANFFKKFAAVMRQHTSDTGQWSKAFFAHISCVQRRFWKAMGITEDTPWSQLAETINAYFGNPTHPRKIIFEHLRISPPDAFKKSPHCDWLGTIQSTVESVDAQTIINLIVVAQLPSRMKEVFLSKHNLEDFSPQDLQKFLFVNHREIEEARVADAKLDWCSSLDA